MKLLILTLFINLSFASETTLPVLGKIENFSLINSNNSVFSSKEKLFGKNWIAFFFYTKCTDECPRLMSQVKKQSLKWPSIDYVAFTVDPKHDSPNKLKQYSRNFELDLLPNWNFITGEKAKLFKIIEQQFLVPTKLKIHTQKVILIDKSGLIRGYYSLIDDVKELDRALEILK